MRRERRELGCDSAHPWLVEARSKSGRLQLRGDDFRKRLGQRPGLVEADRIDRGERLERVEALHQDTPAHQGPGRGKQRRGRRQRQRARTRHDQHRDRDPDGARRIDERPDHGGESGEDEHPPQERAGDAVGGPEHRRAVGHRRAHQAHDPFVSGVGADALGALQHRCAQVDAAGDRLVAAAANDRARLAGEQRLVDLGVALEQAAVGGKRLAREHADTITGLQAMQRNHRRRAVVADDADGARQPRQRAFERRGRRGCAS
jgi:hypothetical protein